MAGHLKLLMKLFGISNNDLALLLRVDTSLVSKWRNGSRSMRSNSEYIRKLAAYILELDQKSNYKKVRELLSEDYESAKTCSVDKLTLFLEDYIKNPGNKTDYANVLEEMMKSKSLTKIEPVYFWEGNEGRREAIKYFTKYAISLSPNVEIISFTTESNLWFHEQPEFLAMWMSLIKEFFAKGNVMKIVHPMNRNYYEIAASMTKWLPLHLTCDVKGYYLKQYRDLEPVKITILAIKNKMALFSISIDDEGMNCKTWAVYDSPFANEIEKVARRYFKDSIALFKRFSLDSRETEKELIEDMCSLYEKDSACYFYNDFDSMLPGTEEKRREMLRAAGLSENKTNHVLSVFNTIEYLRKDCQCYFLIDLESLKRWLQKEVIKTNMISLFACEEVDVPGQMYVDSSIDFLDSLSEYDNMHICIVDDEVYKEMGDLIFCCGGKNVHTFVTTRAKESAMALEVKEYTVAAALYQKLELTWRSTPHLMKRKEYVVEYLKKEIRELLRN